MPTAKQVNFANRWLYMAPSEAQLRAGVKVLAEERNGGQMSDASVANNYGLGLYKSKINNKQFNAYVKFGMPVGEHHDHAAHKETANEHSECGNECTEDHSKEKDHSECGEECTEDHSKDNDHAECGDDCKEDHAKEANHSEHEGEAEGECHEVEKSLALVADYTYHEQNSFFGIKNYNADMHSVFTNLLFQGGFNESNRYELGASFRFDRYNELLVDRFMQNNTTKMEQHINLDRTERTAGFFGEYTFSKEDKLTFIVGARGDHNSLYGWLFTPRANFKWDITDKLTFRASGGRGYRSPNPISDNMGILATGRQISIVDNLKMEDAWT